MRHQALGAPLADGHVSISADNRNVRYYLTTQDSGCSLHVRQEENMVKVSMHHVQLEASNTREGGRLRNPAGSCVY